MCYIDFVHASGPVAQLGARFHGMEEVVSSNLTRSTIFAFGPRLSPPTLHFPTGAVSCEGIAERSIELWSENGFGDFSERFRVE